MLTVDQYEFIRTGLRVYGLSVSELARQTGHSRNTIRKIKQQEHCGYSRRSHQPCPVMEPYSQVIDSWLKDDEEQHRKQRHTARRIYNVWSRNTVSMEPNLPYVDMSDRPESGWE